MLVCADNVVTAAEAGHVLRVVPEREGHRLDVQWSVPPEQRACRCVPCGLLSHLLGCVLQGGQMRASLGDRGPAQL